MDNKEALKKFEEAQVGDIIVDIDGKDRVGFGKGEITAISEDKDFSFVKFEKKELLILVVNNKLKTYDRAGETGTKRCYFEEEVDLTKVLKDIPSTIAESDNANSKQTYTQGTFDF